MYARKKNKLYSLRGVSKMMVYKCEYYESKIGGWVEYYSSIDIESAKKELNSYITGNPKKRLAKYEKSGVRKIKYKLLYVVC